MPPSSKELGQEGALFKSFLLIRDGTLDEVGLSRMLCDEPARYPGSSGTRRYQDNVTDLKAQVAANHCGIRLIHQLIEEYSMKVVQVCKSCQAAISPARTDDSQASLLGIHESDPILRRARHPQSLQASRAPVPPDRAKRG